MEEIKKSNEKAKKTNNQKNVRKQKSNTKKTKNENLKPMVVKHNSKAVVKVEDKPLAIKEEFSFKKENLKIIPLGGIEEIGKNITVFEYGNDIILVDCGVAFPEDDMLGIDLVIPDFSYLVKNIE